MLCWIRNKRCKHCCLNLRFVDGNTQIRFDLVAPIHLHWNHWSIVVEASYGLRPAILLLNIPSCSLKGFWLIASKIIQDSDEIFSFHSRNLFVQKYNIFYTIQLQLKSKFINYFGFFFIFIFHLNNNNNNDNNSNIFLSSQ